MCTRIYFDHLTKQRILPDYTYSKARRDSYSIIILLFYAHKISCRNDIVHIVNGLHIRIEIDPSIMIQNPKSGIVTDKSIFAGSISLPCVGNSIYIKIALIPTLDLIVRKILLPRSNALLSTFRKWFTTKPAIMYNFRNHLITGKCLYSSECRKRTASLIALYLMASTSNLSFKRETIKAKVKA